MLQRGRRAQIAEIVGGEEQVQRIKELGLQPGVTLEMIRPGSPCIVRMQGHTLCIRGNELLNVLVCPGE
jgi:ferrous iron transport protein A